MNTIKFYELSTPNYLATFCVLQKYRQILNFIDLTKDYV